MLRRDGTVERRMFIFVVSAYANVCTLTSRAASTESPTVEDKTSLVAALQASGATEQMFRTSRMKAQKQQKMRPPKWPRTVVQLEH